MGHFPMHPAAPGCTRTSHNDIVVLRSREPTRTGFCRRAFTGPPGRRWKRDSQQPAGDGCCWRRLLAGGARRAAENLKASGCRILYLDGSYVTDKGRPSDFDGCWDTTGVSGESLGPVLLSFGNRRAAQKAKYHGELFPSSAVADGQGTIC